MRTYLVVACVLLALASLVDCQACSTPYPSITNANSPTMNTADGSTTSYTCNLGYVSDAGVASPPYANCTAGVWSTLHTCIQINTYCSSPPAPPSILNAATPTPVQTVNSLTNFTCSNGYTSSGGATQPYYSCNAYNSTTGSWSPGVTYSCNTFTGYCNTSTAPTLTNANTPTPQTYVGANTSFTCDLGYVSSIAPSAPYYTCSQSSATSGLWSSVQGTCTAINPYCNSSTAPSTSNANSPTPQTKVTQQTTFTCNWGYTSNGGATSPYYTCNQYNSTIGQWSAVTYGCPLITNYCPPDPSVNSKPLTAPSGSFGLTLGSTVSLVCPSSYIWVSSSGSLSVTCQVSTATAGVWSVAAGYCVPQSTATSTTPSTVSSTTSGITFQWWFYVLIAVCGALIVVLIAMGIALIYYCVIMKKYSHNGLYSRSNLSVRPLSKY